MIDSDTVLQVINQKGPVIPREVVKAIGGDTFIVGAVLSTLVDAKKLRMSSAKIGGSSVYYIPGQEGRLEILYQYLNEKDKKAYDLLKEKKIIRDTDADPLLRVALRNIKDFAKGLDVQIGDHKELFWKWHMSTNEEVEQSIRLLLGMPIAAPKEQKQQMPAVPQQETKLAEQKMPASSVIQEPAIVQPPVFQPRTDMAREPSRPVVQQEKRQDRQVERQSKIFPDPIPAANETSKESTKEKQTEAIKGEDLLTEVKRRFSEKNIEILETSMIRKNSDIEMILKIPTEVGKVRFFCKIRDKKKTNDKDLSSLYVDAQMKKLPVLYVSTGELTKKAEEKLESEFRIITFMRL